MESGDSSYSLKIELAYPNRRKRNEDGAALFGFIGRVQVIIVRQHHFMIQSVTAA